MAELDFRHNVSEIPAGSDLPSPVQRREHAETAAQPDFQTGMQQYASATNWMSKIGSTVAAKASNYMAQQLGAEAGKNPHGELGPSFTEFDENFAKSYQTQAQMTLGLQANKLVTDSNIEVAKAPRITPGLIAKTNQQVSLGLQNIFKNAPNEVRADLEYRYGSLQLSQTQTLTEKMISDQRKDRADTTNVAAKNNAEQAFALSVAGNDKAAEITVNNNKALLDAAANDHIITKTDAKDAHDSARQSMLNGQVTRAAKDARSKDKLDQFYKDYANKKPDGMSEKEWITAGHAAVDQMNFLENLRRQDENLEMAKFKTRLALNPSLISDTDINQIKSKLNPIEFEQIHLDYISAMKTYNKEQASSDHLIKNWGDPRAHAAASEKDKNTSFNAYVDSAVKQGMSQQEAEVQVAAQAGGTIPEFTKSIQNRLKSPNPDQVESAAQQMHVLYEMGKGQVLNDLTEQDKVMYASVSGLRDTQDPNKALQQLHETIYSQDPDLQTSFQASWANFKSNTKPVGMSDDAFGLTLAGLKKGTFLTTGDEIVYGNDLLNEYKRNFIISGGNAATAKTLLQQSVKDNYGITYVNGFKQTVKHPIEKVYNLPSDSTGVIQEDLTRQLQPHFDQSKKLFDEGKVKEYWSIVPRETSDSLLLRKQEQHKQLAGEFNEKSLRMRFGHLPALNKYNQGTPIEVLRHFKNKAPEKYTVVLKSNPYATTTDDPNHPTNGGWDIAISNGNGVRNLYREAPNLGIITYDADIKYVKATYLKLHPLE